MNWQKTSGYNKRSKVEATMSRYKWVIGDTLKSRHDARRATEVAIGVKSLNRMNALGRAKFVRVACSKRRRRPNASCKISMQQGRTVLRMVRWYDTKLSRDPDVNLCHNTLLISESVRDVIERFEPDVHQFLPVDIYLSPCPFESGEVAVARSYWLVVGQFFDAVSVEHTHPPRANIAHPDGRTEPGMWDFSGAPTNQPRYVGPVIFDRSAIAGRHLRIDLNFTKREHPFSSEELGSALLGMDIYGARLEHFDEV